jgi:hypothetical protein
MHTIPGSFKNKVIYSYVQRNGPTIMGAGAGGVVSFMLRPLDPRGQNPRYPLNKRLVGVRNRSRLCEEEENLLYLPEIESRPSSP